MPPIPRRDALGLMAAPVLAAALTSSGMARAATSPVLRSWPLDTPRRAGIHDLAPATDGGVWFTAQASGHLGWFDPATGKSELIALGER